MMRTNLIGFTTALLLTLRASADRVCGATTDASTYPWKVGAGRYDGAESGEGTGTATVAFSIAPGNSAQGTFFECVAEWPESWAGWYEDGNIIWGDCIWAGNGPTYDTAVAFAVDWKNRTMYLSHTFPCSDVEG